MGKPNTTKRGTPCASAWTEEWIARVNETEDSLEKRICGGLSPDGSPCTMTSDHSSGRCRYHGGSHLTGAPKGNQNARLHGLYSRRLQTCGPHCLCWETCPFSGDDLLALEPKKRPNCVYEQLEYDELLATYLPEEAEPVQEEPGPKPNIDPEWPFPDFNELGKRPPEKPNPHLAHNVALLQVMMSRAAAALSVHSLTETTRATGDNYSMESSKMSAALQAFLRIAREHHRYLRELNDERAKTSPEPGPVGLADYMQPILKKAEGVLEECLEEESNREKECYSRPGAPLRPGTFVGSGPVVVDSQEPETTPEPHPQHSEPATPNSPPSADVRERDPPARLAAPWGP